MDSSNESINQDQPPALSAETVLAVRRYNQQIASYTLRQWNIAKLESERKERDRRKRRADYLVQQQQSAKAVPAVRPLGSLASAGVHGLRSASEGLRPNMDGPLMMVSKRRSERALSGGVSVPSVVPVQPITRHSHDQRYTSRVDQRAQSHDIHADITSIADQPQHQHQHKQPQQQRPRRHQRSSHGSYAAELVALNPISPISAGSTMVEPCGKPETIQIESVPTGLGSSTSRSLDDRPLTPPRWQHRVPASTPPITIPRPSAAAVVPAAAGSASSGGSSAPRSASPARALGFAAHLGMTSISKGPSLADAMSTSTSTSNPTSEGSSRMSSFSEVNGLPGIRHSSKMVIEENSPDNMLDIVRPKRSHRTSLGATTAQRGFGGPCAVEGAIGTLRRMTVSGDETGVFGALDHH